MTSEMDTIIIERCVEGTGGSHRSVAHLPRNKTVTEEFDVYYVQ